MLGTHRRHSQRPIHLRHKRRKTPSESYNEAKQIKRHHKAKKTLTELINYAQVVKNSFIGRNAHRMLRLNYNSDDSGSDHLKQLTYIPEPQTLSICSVSQKIESGQAKEIIVKSPV